MRKLLFAVAAFVAILSGCSKGGSQEPVVRFTPDEDIMVKTLLFTEWSSVSAIMSMHYADFRSTLIARLAERSKNSPASLEAMSDVDLSWGAMMHKFLLDAGAYSATQLSGMTLADCRNALIELNAAKTGSPLSQFHGNNNARNLNAAYGWWFVQNSTTKQLIDKLNNVAGNTPAFDLKDSRGSGMDVLRIVRADEAYTYLGVYHSMVSSNRFKLFLAGSNDLKTWTYLAELGDRAHQGDIEKWGSGYLVANEQDTVAGSNNVQIRYYASYANLLANNPSYKRSFVRSFAPTAEGTPDIRKLEGSGPADSYILIGFHYYENTVRDQQAFGILKNFSEWRTWRDEVSNFNIKEMGYWGNIGARSGFTRSGSYVLQEAQLVSGDWSSWRFLFGNGAFYYTLHPATALGSTSFANPGIAPIGPDKFAVTSFMPTQGNQAGERGELLYTVQF